MKISSSKICIERRRVERNLFRISLSYVCLLQLTNLMFSLIIFVCKNSFCWQRPWFIKSKHLTSCFFRHVIVWWWIWTRFNIAFNSKHWSVFGSEHVMYLSMNSVTISSLSSSIFGGFLAWIDGWKCYVPHPWHSLLIS